MGSPSSADFSDRGRIPILAIEEPAAVGALDPAVPIFDVDDKDAALGDNDGVDFTGAAAHWGIAF
jgi:hypothetical protein